MESNKCVFTGKSKFKSPGEAKNTMLSIKSAVRHYIVTGKRMNRRMGKAKQCRYYFCIHCKSYHLTSDKSPLKQKKRQKLYKERLEYTKNFIKSKQDGEEWKKDSLPFPEIKIKNNELV